MIRILCVGKKSEPIFVPAVLEYEKRIKQLGIQFEVISTEHSTLPPDRARVYESTLLLSRLGPSDFVILFDERGAVYTTAQFAKYIDTAQSNSRTVVCVIGGAHGVGDVLLQRADVVLCFGASVFPHQLVRVLVLEQLYRGLTVLKRLPYHNA